MIGVAFAVTVVACGDDDAQVTPTPDASVAPPVDDQDPATYCDPLPDYRALCEKEGFGSRLAYNEKCLDDGGAPKPAFDSGGAPPSECRATGTGKAVIICCP